jgi:hypothetical protein
MRLGQRFESAHRLSPFTWRIGVLATSHKYSEDVPIGLGTVRPTFVRMHIMFQRIRIQGVPSTSLEG